jgi:uncharacterized protein YciI
MYILDFQNQKPVHEVDDAIEAHRAFLRKYTEAGVFLVSGAKVPRSGGIIIATGIDRARLDAILAEAPFLQNGSAICVVTEFKAVHVAAVLDGHTG